MMEFSGTPIEWNRLCMYAPHAQFLQSYEWGIFQKALGRKVWYLGGGGDKGQVQCLAIQYPLLGKQYYMMCPSGPVGLSDDAWWRKFFAWADMQGALFARVEPRMSISSALSASLKHVRDVDPSVTRIIDLSRSEPDLLSAMHQKTRYNINLAQKKGVEVTSILFGEITEQDIRQWWRLSRQTANRNRIATHSYVYYKTLFTVFPHVSILKAVWNDETIAMAVDVSFGDTAYYLYGASADNRRDVMAPYLLQWYAMQAAKKNGYKYYDFWGIAPDDSPSHRLAGVTRFKKGFGGEVVTYPGTFDMPFKKLRYGIYTFARSVRRLL